MTLLRDTRGTTAVEFALVAPLLITMVLGVLQAGLWMGTWNSMRSAANDTGRYVTVEYQKSNRIANIDIAVEARRRATSAPYSLNSAGVTTYVSDETTQQITGVTQKSLKIVYNMPNILQFAGMGSFQISY
ncbi:MAG: pilus assembly protein, partial [Proteobacteria bacterium]|nr:pilus assembly protein [Pseudomonadota bacterium]